MTGRKNPAAWGAGRAPITTSVRAVGSDDNLHHFHAQAPVLRDYQAALDRDIRDAYRRGARRVLAVSPTGSGKTVLFASVVAGAARKGRRVLILAHRVEIIEQIGAALDRHALPFGMIAPGADETDHAVQIASIATLARRLDRWRDRFDLVVLDECHHAPADSWRRVLDAFPSARLLGTSATPERLDGRGLGDIFEHMVVGPSVADLIAAGHLSPFTIFAPASAPDLKGVRTRAGDYATEDLRERMGGAIVESAVKEYQRLCAGVPAVAFCLDIAHSEAVAAAFRAAGVRAKHVDGETPADERRAAVAALGRGQIDVLCNVALFGEGVDVPGIGAAILLRPTQSLALFLQQCGRALRPAPGKARALILDFASNSSRHGLPDDPREWSLDSTARRDRPTAAMPKVRRCRECGAVNSIRADRCGNCGNPLVVSVARREIDMRLQEAGGHGDPRALALAARLRRMTYRERLRWAGRDEGRLRAVARACNYQPGWVRHVLEEIDGGAA
ncbi:DEAD/DEAH box helicase [Methylocystis echinoides]|uniref:DEAD/DEAH box helicase n=1 Tax=Methylocystis echinoides TaxID=29468 RepID=A0A9W6LT59_9HYPH|nr:DEAD/DEAH box helicase [Methylocystis echinoides]GLI94298.1 DEAD/DEAH box helicase [Methylocystis echinoides]